MEQKTIVITGASDGIGAAAARQLREEGHKVVLVGRNPEKTARLGRELSSPYHTADFSDLSQVARLAGELRQYPRIDVLANNAGAAFAERTVTEDGFERTFQVNLLGGFLLTDLLIGKLCASRATVIQTASVAVNLFGAHFDVTDLNHEKKYSPQKAYGDAKLAGVLFTRELHRRYSPEGLCAVAFEPGIVRTNFGSESLSFVNFCYHSPLKYLFTVSPERSARRLADLALGVPGEDFCGGEIYSGKRPYRVRFKDPDGRIARELFDACRTMTAPFRDPDV